VQEEGGGYPEFAHECMVDELLEEGAYDCTLLRVETIHIQGGALLQFEENCLFAGAVRVDLHHINESKLAVEIDKVLPGTAFALY
jgi:hypothetical protein